MVFSFYGVSFDVPNSPKLPHVWPSDMMADGCLKRWYSWKLLSKHNEQIKLDGWFYYVKV